jgi:hypothetical protein
MQPITLCLTALTRFMAVVKPLKYLQLMTPRRIMIYCLCCYLAMIPTEDRIWFFFFGSPVGGVIYSVFVLITVCLPLIVSLVLSIVTLRALNVHLKGTSSSNANNEARDSRTIVIATLIETIVPLLTIFPYYFYLAMVIILGSTIFTLEQEIVSIPAIRTITGYFSDYQCYSGFIQGLITLFVVAPYRRLLLRPFRKNVVTPAPILVGTELR